METEEIGKKINDMIYASLKDRIAYEDITPDKHIMQDLQADSLNALEIFLTIMSEFDIEMERRVIVGLKNIGELHQYVKKLMHEKVQVS